MQDFIVNGDPPRWSVGLIFFIRELLLETMSFGELLLCLEMKRILWRCGESYGDVENLVLGNREMWRMLYNRVQHEILKREPSANIM
jgi:hypothetical protein